jgi:hypothetical protein
MKFYQQILTKNDCYKSGKTIVPKGVMVHSTGANNPNLKRYVPGNDAIGYNTGGNHWDMSGTGACVHAFIGKLADGSIGVVQTLPFNMRGWHCGQGSKGSANNTHISFEICEDGLHDSNYFNAVYQAAVELTADLCKSYGLNPLSDGVVICHSEGHSRGIASNHGDVMHWFPIHGKNMDTFRNDVSRLMKGETEEEMTQDQFNEFMNVWLMQQRQKEATDDWQKQAVDKAKKAGFTDGTAPLGVPTRVELMAMILAAM